MCEIPERHIQSFGRRRASRIPWDEWLRNRPPPNRFSRSGLAPIQTRPAWNRRRRPEREWSSCLSWSRRRFRFSIRTRPTSSQSDSRDTSLGSSACPFERDLRLWGEWRTESRRRCTRPDRHKGSEWFAPSSRSRPGNSARRRIPESRVPKESDLWTELPFSNGF